MSDSVLLGSCGAIGVITTMIPTLLLIASEILGMSKGKSNGIIHFVYCIAKKIIKKEPITSEDILQCLVHSENMIEEIEEHIEEDLEKNNSK
tara:strand:+ start:3749 stop:4024 length:276 start_codon:yes stop_codon:yes gene_type:complete